MCVPVPSFSVKLIYKRWPRGRSEPEGLSSVELCFEWDEPTVYGMWMPGLQLVLLFGGWTGGRRTALLEEACHWRVGFVSKKPSPFPVLSLFLSPPTPLCSYGSRCKVAASFAGCHVCLLAASALP